MKQYYILDIFEYDLTFSYAFDNLDNLLDFLTTYALDNPSHEFKYFIYQDYYNQQMFDKFNITIIQ